VLKDKMKHILGGDAFSGERASHVGVDYDITTMERDWIWISWSLVKLPTQPLPTLVRATYKVTEYLL